MTIIKFLDIYPWTTGKEDVFLYSDTSTPKKPENAKRYRLVIEVPDFKEVDGTIKVKGTETADPIVKEESK